MARSDDPQETTTDDRSGSGAGGPSTAGTDAGSDSPWLTAAQQRSWRAWLQAHGELQAALGRQLAGDSDLSLADFEVLVTLSEATEVRLRVLHLAEELRWERSRVSHQLTRMERRGLIERQQCAGDARGAYVVLTDLGRERLEQAAPGHARAVRALVFDGLDDRELASLTRIHETVLSRLREQ